MSASSYHLVDYLNLDASLVLEVAPLAKHARPCTAVDVNLWMLLEIVLVIAREQLAHEWVAHGILSVLHHRGLHYAHVGRQPVAAVNGFLYELRVLGPPSEPRHWILANYLDVVSRLNPVVHVSERFDAAEDGSEQWNGRVIKDA